MSDTTAIRAEDGRTLRVRVTRENLPRSVLVHHGMPGCGRLYDPWVNDATTRNIRLVSYDRPGYGGSSPHPGHSVGDCAADVRAIADALGIDRLGVWGWSGGGPHALACAALAPDLVVGAAVLASSGPWDAPGLDFCAGMGRDNVDDIELFFSDPRSARMKNMDDRDHVLKLTSKELHEALESLLSPIDAGVLTGDFAEWLLHAEQGECRSTRKSELWGWNIRAQRRVWVRSDCAPPTLRKQRLCCRAVE